MSTFLDWTLQNSLVVAVALPLVWLASKFLKKRPADLHLLWLLLLIKLVTPPVAPWSVPVADLAVWNAKTPETVETTPPVSATIELDVDVMAVTEPIETTPDVNVTARCLPATAELAAVLFVDEPPLDLLGSEGTAAAIETEGSPPPAPLDLSFFLFAAWALGTGLVVAGSCIQLFRVARLISRGTPASGNLRRLVAAAAGTRRLDSLRILASRGVASPCVACLGRPVLLWPENLPDQGSAAKSVVAHELAHLARRDHWVAAFELAVMWTAWWNPLFWIVRWQLHESRELACDALALEHHPEGRRDMAEMLLTLSHGGPSAGSAVSIVGAGFAARFSLRRRLTMLFDERVSGRTSLAGMFLMASLGVATLPGISTVCAGDESDEDDVTAVAESEESEESDVAEESANDSDENSESEEAGESDEGEGEDRGDEESTDDVEEAAERAAEEAERAAEAIAEAAEAAAERAAAIAEEAAEHAAEAAERAAEQIAHEIEVAAETQAHVILRDLQGLVTMNGEEMVVLAGGGEGAQSMKVAEGAAEIRIRRLKNGGLVIEQVAEDGSTRKRMVIQSGPSDDGHGVKNELRTIEILGDETRVVGKPGKGPKPRKEGKPEVEVEVDATIVPQPLKSEELKAVIDWAMRDAREPVKIAQKQRAEAERQAAQVAAELQRLKAHADESAQQALDPSHRAAMEDELALAEIAREERMLDLDEAREAVEKAPDSAAAVRRLKLAELGVKRSEIEIARVKRILKADAAK